VRLILSVVENRFPQNESIIYSDFIPFLVLYIFYIFLITSDRG